MIVIPEIMQRVVDAVNAEMLHVIKQYKPDVEVIRFDYGHPSDIASKLAILSKTPQNAVKKFPLICLFMDVNKEVDNEKPGERLTARLNMVICCNSTATWTPQDRTERTFKPILWPIYKSFMKHLARSKATTTPVNGVFNHRPIDRYQWGKGGLEYYENGEKGVFKDVIDAVELLDLEVEFINNC